MTGSIALVSTSNPAALAAIADLQDPDGESLRYLESARSPATRRAYASDWRVFARWAYDTYGARLPDPDERGRVFLGEAVHPALVIRYLTDRGR